jgi:hypothetical protein
MRYSVYLEVHKMNYFLEAINHPIEAFKNKSKAESVTDIPEDFSASG